MPHSPELIANILCHIQQSYPAEHRFEIERPLFLKDRRMQPDIQVFDQAGELVCVVEIGYTRPEKLKRYRQLDIPDVRWYSKAGELVDDYVSIERKIEVIERSFVFKGDPWRQVYAVPDDQAVPCGAVIRQINDFYEHRSWRNLRALLKLADEHELWELSDNDRRWLRSGDWLDLREFVFEHNQFLECEAAFYSNGGAIFCVSHCLLCDEVSEIYASSWFDQLLVNRGHPREYDALWTFQDFLNLHERQAAKLPIAPVPFAEIVGHVEAEWGIRIDLAELEPAQWVG
jgi:hypothetical protein